MRLKFAVLESSYLPMPRSIQTILTSLPEGSHDLSTAVDTQKLRLSGWYRLKIKLQNNNLRKVALTAFDEIGQSTVVEVVCGQGQFGCYVYLSKTIRCLNFDIGKLSNDASQASISFRKISPIEFAWKSIRSGFLKKPIKFLAYFFDPFDPFLVTSAFPVLRLVRDDYKSWITSEETSVVKLFRPVSLRTVESPEICILMTVCDPQPRYLKKAIESVIKQTSPHWQLSIADDASVNPEVRFILETFSRSDRRIRLSLREQRGGISAATNSAFEGVSSPLVTCLDHDDMLSSVTIETAAQHFVKNADCNILFSDEDKIDERGQRFEPYFKPNRFSPELFYSYNYVNHLTVHRAEIIRRVGGWRSEFDGAQDYD